MTTPNQNSASDEEISLAELYLRLVAFLRTVRQKRGLLLFPLGLAVTLGLIIAFGSTAEFRASTRLVPYRAGGGGGNLSGLAGLAGIRLPEGGGGEQVITSDLYPDLVATFDFQSAVATAPIAFVGHDSLRTAVEYFTDERPLGGLQFISRYTVGLPSLLRSALRSSSVDQSTAARARSGGPLYRDAKFERTVKEIGERLVVTTDKKTGIITVSATMPDPVAAADLVRATSTHLTETVIRFEVQKAAEQFRFIDEQYMASKGRYEMVQRALASFADRNRMLVSATAQIEQERLSREVESTFELYQQFSREREQARIRQNQDTPIFTVLQQPAVPNQRSSPHRSRILLVSVILGLFAGVTRVALRHLLASRPPSFSDDGPPPFHPNRS